MQLFMDKVIHDATLGANPDAAADIDIEFRAHARAIFVSRPSERVYAYTGPCGEPGCDGQHLVAHLPMEHDHTPDGYEPTIVECSVNGGAFDYNELEKVLAVCGPVDRVAKVREFVQHIKEIEAGSLDRRKGTTS